MESVANDYEINFWVTECSARTRRVDSDLGSNPALPHENRMVYQWLHLSEPKERQMLVTSGSVADMACIHTKSRDVHKHRSKQTEVLINRPRWVPAAWENFSQLRLRNKPREPVWGGERSTLRVKGFFFVFFWFFSFFFSCHGESQVP